MLFVSLANVVRIVTCLPFLGEMTLPDKVFAYSAVQPIYRLLGILNGKKLLISYTVTFAIAVFLASVVRLLLLLKNTRLSFATNSILSIGIYKIKLYQ
jgi:hypothetical protein